MTKDPRYELRTGEFGQYFHDTRDERDMPLVGVLMILNDGERKNMEIAQHIDIERRLRVEFGMRDGESVLDFVKRLVSKREAHDSPTHKAAFERERADRIRYEEIAIGVHQALKNAGIELKEGHDATLRWGVEALAEKFRRAASECTEKDRACEQLNETIVGLEAKIVAVDAENRRLKDRIQSGILQENRDEKQRILELRNDVKASQDSEARLFRELEEMTAERNALAAEAEANGEGARALRAKYGAHEDETMGQFIARLASRNDAKASQDSEARLSRELDKERAEFKSLLHAELDANKALRQKYGAHDDETMGQFIARLAMECEQYRDIERLAKRQNQLLRKEMEELRSSVSEVPGGMWVRREALAAERDELHADLEAAHKALNAVGIPDMDSGDEDTRRLSAAERIAILARRSQPHEDPRRTEYVVGLERAAQSVLSSIPEGVKKLAGATEFALALEQLHDATRDRAPKHEGKAPGGDPAACLWCGRSAENGSYDAKPMCFDCYESGRGAKPPVAVEPPRERFEVVGDEVIDHKTGLIWQREPAGRMFWQKGMDYAASLGGDWRLPSAAENDTIIDRTRHSPASGFPGMPSECFWSSSSYAFDDVYAWYVYFGYGHVSLADKSNERQVRCVRSGPSALRRFEPSAPSDPLVVEATRAELLAEIDKVLEDAERWVGGRLDSVKQLITDLTEAENEIPEDAIADPEVTSLAACVRLLRQQRDEARTDLEKLKMNRAEVPGMWTLRERAWCEWAEKMISRPGVNVSDEDLRAAIEQLIFDVRTKAAKESNEAVLRLRDLTTALAVSTEVLGAVRLEPTSEEKARRLDEALEQMRGVLLGRGGGRRQP